MKFRYISRAHVKLYHVWEKLHEDGCYLNVIVVEFSKFSAIFQPTSNQSIKVKMYDNNKLEKCT